MRRRARSSSRGQTDRSFFRSASTDGDAMPQHHSGDPGRVRSFIDLRLLSWVPWGRIQSTLLPSGHATMRTASHPAQMVRSALMYHGPIPNGSALGSRGGSAHMASVTGQAKPVSTTPVPLSESQPTQPRGRATTLMRKHAGFMTFLPSTLELPNTGISCKMGYDDDARANARATYLP